jgi:protein phosphatase
MGTTLVAMVILGRKVYVANVGNSRAYVIDRKEITQVTEDHSWTEEQVRAGLLSPEEARQHPRRHEITRLLGTRPSAEIDLFEGIINAGDILLLCSDGLTEYVSDAEILEMVLGREPYEAARLLVQRANERGGRDNITVLIVSASGPAPSAPSAPPRQEKRRGLFGFLRGRS